MAQSRNEQLKHLYEEFVDAGLPEYMFSGLSLYILDGIPPGNFLQSILKNDLIESVLYADQVNQRKLVEWVSYLTNHVPAMSFGSSARYESWCERGGLSFWRSNEQKDV